ncbi:helix-turn-helix transcriptional regulator [bacterium]|nr:helix-turn-helix transcriptional regulator [bacterium]
MTISQPDTIEVLPIKLKKLRQIHGWSQGQLGKKLGVNIQRVSKYENGIVCPPPKMLVKIANVFDVSVDYLLGNEKEVLSDLNENQHFLQCAQDISLLPKDEQKTLMDLVDAYIKRSKFRELMTN